jgi:AraC-like DNA-binding protein
MLPQALPSFFLAHAGDRTPPAPMLPDALVELTERLAARLGDPLLGLHVAQALPRGACGILEFLVRTAPTADVLTCELVRYAPATLAPIVLERVHHGAHVTLRARIDGVPAMLGRHGNELLVALAARIARACTGAPAPIARVVLPHPAPADAEVAALAQELGIGEGAVVFGGEHVAVTFDAAWLATPLASADAVLHEVLRARLRDIATSSDPLRGCIEASLRRGEPTLDSVAASVGLSAGELRAWVAERGTTWRAFVDGTRASLARAYLEDARLSVSEVAYLLGYADVRAFTRAHKRWTGSVPSKARPVMAAVSHRGRSVAPHA